MYIISVTIYANKGKNIKIVFLISAPPLLKIDENLRYFINYPKRGGNYENHKFWSRTIRNLHSQINKIWLLIPKSKNIVARPNLFIWQPETSFTVIQYYW